MPNDKPKRVVGRPFTGNDDPRKGVGKKGRSGRPPNKLRKLLAREAEKELPKLKRELRNYRTFKSSKEFVDLMLKYGIGTTITPTKADGTDVVAPGKMTPAEIRAALVTLLAPKDA